MDWAQNSKYLIMPYLVELVRSKKLFKVMRRIGPEYTTKEMFSYIWSLDDAHRFLTPVLIPSVKSKDVSYKHYKQGNLAYKHLELEKALDCFNLALLNSPHPDIVIENSNYDIQDSAISPCKEEYVALAQAYESRSVLLFDLKQYEKCSRDIDRALALCCLQLSRTQNLLEMKDKCQKFISKGLDKTFDTSTETPNSSELAFAYVDPEPPKLAEPNPTIPSLSSAVKLAYTPSQGRHLIAARDINPGEILSVDEGYCTTTYQKYSTIYCNVCVRRCLAPLPCPTCSMVIFCSEECRTQGLSGCHWQECPVLPTLYSLENKNMTLYLPYKILLKTSHTKIKKMIPVLEQEAKNQPPEILGFNKNGIYDSTDYTSVYHLVTNKDKRSRFEILGTCLNAFILTKLMQHSGRYFLDRDGKAYTPSLEDIILTGSVLFHQIMNIGCNAREISYMKADVNYNFTNDHEGCGDGVSSSSSLVNHSCNPTCGVFFYGKTEVMRAMCFIPAGGSVTTCYAVGYDDISRYRRRMIYMQYYFFKCTCEACENDWTKSFDLTQKPILKCLKCNQAINPLLKTCSACGLSYDEQKVVAGSPYTYSHLCRKIERIMFDFIAATTNITVKGSNSDKDIKAVRLLISLFCKYVHQPNYYLRFAMCTLRFVCDRRASCVYVKDFNPPDKLSTYACIEKQLPCIKFDSDLEMAFNCIV